MSEVDGDALEHLIADAKASGGAEMSNAQLFVERLTGALGLPRPGFASEDTRHNDYVFERNVTFRHPDGTSSNGRIDCYKRGCFILEAKQSAKRSQAVASEQLALAGLEATRKLGHAKRGTRSWDKVMIAARAQAEDYARALPVDHGYPPFLLIVDVGNVIEVYADFSGLGKNYDHFPDRQSYRLSMDDLGREDVQARLTAIWTAPRTLDPTARSAEVTRDIAERLAVIAKRLEAKHPPKAVAEFLMRCLFTMFVEDAGPEDARRRLIPDRGFERLLRERLDTPHLFVPALESLWRTMNTGGFDGFLGSVLKRFNGGLFGNATALPLEPDDILELHNAAKRSWADVEPAIFGTLLERALEPEERSSFGAHYTPRPYVERLVIPTIMEPLRADWAEVQAQVADLLARSDERGALRAAQGFHRRLCTTRVLDPACGTGNFLYVALELMKRLEGEVLDAIAALGGEPERIADHPEFAGLKGQQLARSGGRFKVDPSQFFGLELNERAVPIAELVLWLGYLKWEMRTIGVDKLAEPILDSYGTIRHQDALIAYDGRELARDAQGELVTIWDGVTRKAHPITGEAVPDEDARRETYRYIRPRRADWPEAEFIVGNPPFIGGKDMRAELGDGYAEACWAARPEVGGGADFVMHFWDEAARRLVAAPAGKRVQIHPSPSGEGTGVGVVGTDTREKTTAPTPTPPLKGRGFEANNPLRRFGFITTNSITQTFSRRVVERWLAAKAPVSLVYAVPDHPWLKSADKAAVRIAMTVGQAGRHEGVLAEVVSEAELNTDTPRVELARREGKITAQLTIGADLSASQPLLANEGIASPGVKLHGAGFIVTPSEAAGLGLGRVDGLERHILHYRHGRDLAQRARGAMVIDLFGLSADQVRERFPAVYQRLSDRVRGEREAKVGRSKDMAEYAKNWWVFGKPRTELRSGLSGLPRYIATVETAKHRFFQFLDADIRPDNMLVAMGLNGADRLAVLSSRLHVHWAINSGGWLGVGNDPRYSKTRTFDPFPFPAGERPRLAELGERLDAFRKERLAQHDVLTMTGLYNLLERVRELEAGPSTGSGQGRAPLSPAERDAYEAGQVAILKELHDEIDRETFAAYGWDDLAPALVGKPGGTTPSPHKRPEQEAAEEELLVRLVALNAERVAEERAGTVRWLRPDYQRPRLGAKVKGEVQVEAEFDGVGPGGAAAEAIRWPTDGLDQIRSLRALLAGAPAPLPVPVLAARYAGRSTDKRRKRVEEVLDTLVATGAARRDDAARYYVPR